MAEERLQKLIARSGACSRRQAETWIAEGRVEVNGRVVRVPGTKADPLVDSVTVDGRELRREPVAYWMLHKPLGVICADADPYGRACARMVVGPGRRLHPVGRLDASTSGLILFTNDGALAHDLIASPSFDRQRFDVAVALRPDRSDLQALRRGLMRGHEWVRVERAARALRVSAAEDDRLTWLDVEVSDAPSRRRLRWLFDAVGHPVVRLRRTGIDGLSLDRLHEGASRRLTPHERLEVLEWGTRLARLERAPRAAS